MRDDADFFYSIPLGQFSPVPTARTPPSAAHVEIKQAACGRPRPCHAAMGVGQSASENQWDPAVRQRRPAGRFVSAFAVARGTGQTFAFHFLSAERGGGAQLSRHTDRPPHPIPRARQATIPRNPVPSTSLSSTAPRAAASLVLVALRPPRGAARRYLYPTPSPCAVPHSAPPMASPGAAAAASSSALPFLLLLLLLPPLAAAANVTYDHRSLIIDGRRRLLISTSIHYPRSVPAMWPKLVADAKDGGADCIETYVFWNGHEIAPGKYYFEDRFDLVRFAKVVEDAGLYLMLRIGPFVAAEWNFGGVPVWLHYVPGTVFRTNNEPFKRHMKNFTTYIVDMMKKERLFASQGGNIILAQIENEYGDTEAAYGAGGKPYAMWAASMALAQNTGVPWIMCQQYDAPDPVINTCNSFYCDQFQPNSPTKPKFWTENWPGWFQTFGESNPHRPPEDVAFAVAPEDVAFAYHGGTNFGRTSGGPFITTSYDYDAPIDEYGLRRLPKWAHLRELHRSIKLCEHTLLYGNTTFLSLGPKQEADVYIDQSGGCVAFLANVDPDKDSVVTFRNRQYDLPAWSVSILPDCKNVVFNSAKVQSQTLVVDMVPERMQASKPDRWSIFREKTGIWGSAYGNGSKSSFFLELPVNLRTGNNELALLSMTVGLQIGLEGEYYSLFKPEQGNNQRWTPQSEPPKNQPLTWYKVSVDVPEGDDPVGIDMQSMGKGLAWLNGNPIGRYWPRTSSMDNRPV
ncbi:hypothetical protein PR202_ga08874 [Eleusine coracana subsp. coracana]|uniref:beta-galactosidase n=1 Tax=Eleusine coracana subsp. coracana TaxID=191504 RepID=A0AAV5C1E3_ELECO|nr:hypothetical protein PR202_ga08874 [Eleusine coracana subsp. coracana]